MKTKPAAELYEFADLKNRRELTHAVKPAIRLGVFGDPVTHSLSPLMQNAALKHLQIDARYTRFRISTEDLLEAIELARDFDFIGLNITVPHKTAAAKLMDQVDETGTRIGAVNVIKFTGQPENKSCGFNTDGRGFARAIREEFSVDLRDLRIMVLGAGGAGRAIALQCAKENCERLVIANRSFERARQSAETLREFFVGPRVLGPVPRLQAIEWNEAAIRSQIGQVDLIVNATPLGLNPGDASPIAARLLAPHLLIYDTIYSRQQTPTPLVAAGFEAGARAANGLSMLLYQGALAFEIWFGRAAPIEVMRKALSDAE